MTTRVSKKNEVAINGVKYKTIGPVAQRLASQFAPKFVTGDFGKDSQQRTSVWAPTFIGGIGKFRVRPGEPSDRAWWSTLPLRYDRLGLPQLATMTAASGVAGSYTVGAIGELANEIYACFGVAVRKYNNTTDSWGSTVATLPAAATDSITFRMGNVVYLAFATTGGYTYTSDGITWTDDTRDALYLAYWDDLLWGIDNTGLLWWSSQIGAESNDAQLPLPDGSVTDLFTARNAAGLIVLFAATTTGIYAHDSVERKWILTELALPYHPDNGKGATRWRDSTYIPSGLGVYRYVKGDNSAVVTVVGPDRDDGLPSDKRGVIRQLIGTHNDLIAILDGTTAPGALTTFPTRGMSTHHGVVIDPDVGYSSILGWNERAWDVKWLGGSGEQAISWAHVSNAYSVYRLWWAQNQRVYFMPLQRDIVNPLENTTLTYSAGTEELLTPWLDIGQDADGLALSVKIETFTCTSVETVTLDYALNYSTSYTSFTGGTITSNGVTEFLFPNSTAPTGTAFRSIRFRVRTVRGSTTTLRATFLPPTLLYRKKLSAKYGFSVELDLRHEYGNNTPQQQRNALRTALESNALVELSYHNDTGTDLGATDRRFYVDLVEATNLEETGDGDEGTSEVLMVEG
mgnify:FL=1